MLKSSGTIRLIDSGSCRTGEQKVTWNQQGQPGTNGTNGVSGYTQAFRTVSFAGNAEPGTTQVSVSVPCPEGTSVLGSFSTVYFTSANLTSRALAPSKWYPEVFQNKFAVHFDFTRPDGGDFGPGDALNGLLYVTCAATH